MNHQTFLSPSLLVFLFCLGAVLVPRTLADGTPCEKPDGSSSTCVCKTDKGIIDLTPLAGKNGKPRFTGVKDNQNYVYDYNPCNEFTDSAHSSCKNVYICQAPANADSKGFVVGNTDTEQIYKDEKGYYAQYDSSDGVREGKVYLNCDQSTKGKIASVKQDASSKPTIYTFELHSCHACPGGCNKSGGVSSGYIGIIIIVLVLVAIVTYFIAGAVLMKVHYEATGSDIIPNKGFWIQLPLLIKDGCLFTVSPCVELVRSKRNDYQKI